MTGPRACIYGGSFDPPHLGHAMASLWLLATCPIDEVWWVPTARHAFGKRLGAFPARMALCEAAARHLRGVRVEGIEATLPGESRTIDTLEALQAAHPDVQFSVAFGTDLAEALPTFKRWDDLAARFPVYLVPRSPWSGELGIPNVSSSAARDALRRGDLVWLETWLDASVLARLAENITSPPDR